jgi:DNA-binding response OmpR family regulator
MGSQIKVLIIEDDQKISRFLELELEHEGYATDVAADGREGLAKVNVKKYDVVLLDLMLPKLSGIEVCRRMRNAEDHTPVIMLTAKDDVSDKVTGLDSGADDYVTKPFAIEELLARIRVAVSRTRRKERSPELEAGLLKIDNNAHKVIYGGEEVDLTGREYDLLLYLVENRGTALSRDKMLNNVWGFSYMGETNVVDVYVSYLRAKIDQRFGVDIIKTVRGVGYIIEADEEGAYGCERR